MRVRIREGRALEKSKQSGERGAELVRDGCREAGAKLLIGSKVPRVADIDELFAVSCDGIRKDEGVDQDRLRRRLPLGKPLEELSRSSARRDDPAGIGTERGMLGFSAETLDVLLCKVRWCQRQHFGVEFLCMSPAQHIRLGR